MSATRWAAIGGSIIVATFLVWLFQVPYGVPILLSLALLGLLTWYFFTEVYVRVEELETGVVFNRETGAFKRFLPPGRHFLLPFLEYLQTTMDMSFQSVSGATKGARTSEGLPVTLDWWLAYQLKPLSLTSEMRPSMARALPKFASNMVQNHGINCLQLVVEQFSVDDLCRPGIQQQIEQDFKEKAAERLKIFGIEVGRVMVHSIKLPQQVLDALEDAHEREVHAQSEAEALERLYEVISKFDDNHMARLAELERMRMMGKNGVALVYPMATMVEGGQQHQHQSTSTIVPTPRPVVRPQLPPENKP
jgi:regulator of protease activity HflC (stomatin/prohibitin superfamily)